MPVRDDGWHWVHRSYGPDDPGLADLYYRWMAEPPTPAGARPAGLGAADATGPTRSTA